MHDIMAKLKNGKPAASREAQVMRAVCEILTGRPHDSFETWQMRRGKELESAARLAYQVMTGNLVDEVGFIDHASICGLGASPDGLIDDDGMLEIKCPGTGRHLRHLMEGWIPDEYKTQMATQMAVSGRRWVDFVSFDDRMPDDLQLSVVRFKRNEQTIREVEREALAFIVDRDRVLDKIHSYRGGYEKAA